MHGRINHPASEANYCLESIKVCINSLITLLGHKSTWITCVQYLLISWSEWCKYPLRGVWLFVLDPVAASFRLAWGCRTFYVFVPLARFMIRSSSSGELSLSLVGRLLTMALSHSECAPYVLRAKWLV